MKKINYLIAGFMLVCSLAFAQNTYNVVLFSEDGEPFFAFVNGIRQNDRAETNIRVTNLNSEILNVRVVFENKANPQLKQNFNFDPGFEHTINIKRNMKKEIKMRYFGQSPLDEVSNTSIATIPFHTTENAIETSAPVVNTSVGSSNATGSSGNVAVSGTTVVTTTTQNGNTNATGGGTNGSISINMGGVNMSVNTNINDMEVMPQTNSSTVVSKTVTTTSSSSMTTPRQETVVRNEVAPVAASAVNTGCASPMSPAAYAKMKKAIEDKPFSDTKMSTAKVASKNACLSADQIAGICKLFSMDDDKLAYAKYAYPFCVDKESFYNVSNVFSFSSTTDALNKFLEQK